MSSELSLLTIVVLLVAGQGLFLALALLMSKRGNWHANRYLGLFTLVVACTMVDYCIDSSVTDSGALALRTLIWPRDYLYGPALYCYVREITMPGKYPLLPRQWLHFLPALLHAAIYWSLPFLNAPLHRAILINDDSLDTPRQNLVESFLTAEVLTSILHLALYLFLSLGVLRKHRKSIQSTFSYDERISLNWLRNLLYGVSAVYLVWILEELLGGVLSLSDTFNNLLGAGMVLLVFTMSILGLNQPVIFSGRTAALVRAEDDSAAPEAAKYRTSSLSDDLSRQLTDELQQLMTTSKPYLDGELSLPRLADQLGVSPNYLSQIINEQLQQNFFEFVNAYRVDEARRHLDDVKRQHENILTIALESGFKSKSSFYAAFRKQTGLTPGEYRKRL